MTNPDSSYWLRPSSEIRDPAPGGPSGTSALACPGPSGMCGPTEEDITHNFWTEKLFCEG